jgi:hypothetical protein
LPETLNNPTINIVAHSSPKVGTDPCKGELHRLLVGKVKPQPVPASKEELEAAREERKFQKALDLGLAPSKASRLRDPATAKKTRARYVLPRCPECRRTVKHYGRCPIRKEYDLKPYTVLDWQPPRDGLRDE